MNLTPSLAPIPSGAGLTRWTVTTVMLASAGSASPFASATRTRTCSSEPRAFDGWIAWLIAPSVDLSVIGLLLGVRYLATVVDDQHALAKPRRLLVLCGLLTLALDIANALDHRHLGASVVDAIGPVLLIRWADAFYELRVSVRETSLHLGAREAVCEKDGRCCAGLF